MKEAFERIIERLEECRKYVERSMSCFGPTSDLVSMDVSFISAIEIVKEVAEEYKSLPISPESLPMHDEKFNDGWIPCSDGEKEHLKDYLVTDDLGNVVITTYFAVYDRNYDCHWDGEGFYEWREEHGYTKLDEIAYMELPKPYQPKGE